MTSPISDIFTLVIGLGYAGFFLDSGTRRPIEDFSYEQHQAPFISAVERDGFHKDYVNNFVFIPELS